MLQLPVDVTYRNGSFLVSENWRDDSVNLKGSDRQQEIYSRSNQLILEFSSNDNNESLGDGFRATFRAVKKCGCFFH